jgi:hypothetical protein
MDIYKAYKVMAQNCGIKKGDTVKVLRAAEDHEMGWKNAWIKSMNACIGKEYEVKKVSQDEEFYLGGVGWVPFFVLEKTGDCKSLPASIPLNDDEEYFAEFMEDGNISVGCQNISWKTLEKIYEAAKSTREER